MEMNDFVPKGRVIAVSVALSALIVFVVVRYGVVMLSPGPAQAQSRIIVDRGSILDKNGKILAVQTTLYNIAVTRSVIKDKAAFAAAIAPACSLDEAELLARLEAQTSDFFYLKKKISETEKAAVSDAIEGGRLRGIRLEPVQSRTYPENSLASHVVGFLGDDGAGLTGVEYSFQDILSPPATPTSTESRAGYNVMLTIDGAIQYELEKVARSTMEETKAEAVIILTVRAKTGEILSYVSEPSANLNTYPLSLTTERKDRPALYAYEPGSVFKIFSVAAVLDRDDGSDRDVFLCDGAYNLTTQRGETISIKCLDRHGWVTARDILRLSCNDGTAQLVERISPGDFERKLRDFGFGTKTGIELPGETTGLFAPTQRWSARSKPTIAIGQEISVSALQIVGAATALANGGERVKLSLLSRLYTRDGIPVYEHETTSLGRILKPETAARILDYMWTTSETGTGTKASVGDVPMAVKTGTAQMLDRERGVYSSKDFISSCIGIYPVSDPEIIQYVAIVKPVGETYGGRIAAPVISRAANVVIDYLGIGRAQAPSVRHTGIIPVPANQPVEIGEVMPNLTGVSKRMLTPLLSRSDINVLISGDGYVVSQSPAPGSPIREGTTIELSLE